MRKNLKNSILTVYSKWEDRQWVADQLGESVQHYYQYYWFTVSEFVLIVNADVYFNIFVYSCRLQSAANYPCTAECRGNSTSHHQPCNQAVIKSTRQQREVDKKTETHVLNTNWYKDFLWIHVCITRKKVYCHYCLQWYKRGVLSFTKKYDSAFIRDGFQNWKKGHELLEWHEKTECHKKAVLKLTTMQGPSIITQFN